MRIEDFLSTSPASPLPPRKIKREKKKKLGRPAKIPKSERANGNNATPSVYCPEGKKDIVLKGKMTLLKHIRLVFQTVPNGGGDVRPGKAYRYFVGLRSVSRYPDSSQAGFRI